MVRQEDKSAASIPKNPGQMRLYKTDRHSSPASAGEESFFLFCIKSREIPHFVRNDGH